MAKNSLLTTKKKKKVKSKRAKTGIGAIPHEKGYRFFSQIFTVTLKQKTTQTLLKDMLGKPLKRKQHSLLALTTIVR